MLDRKLWYYAYTFLQTSMSALLDHTSATQMLLVQTQLVHTIVIAPKDFKEMAVFVMVR